MKANLSTMVMSENDLPNLHLSRGNWTLSKYLAERSHEPMPPTVGADDDTLHLAKVALNPAGARTIYVVNDEKHLLGAIFTSDLTQRVFERLDPTLYLESHPTKFSRFFQLNTCATTLTARSLMQEQPRALSEQTTVSAAMKEFYRSQLDELPVVNDRGQLVGVIRALDVLREWTEDTLLTKLGDETESYF
jgi:CBS domain-containing protein